MVLGSAFNFTSADWSTTLWIAAVRWANEKQQHTLFPVQQPLSSDQLGIHFSLQSLQSAVQMGAVPTTLPPAQPASLQAVSQVLKPPSLWAGAAAAKLFGLLGEELSPPLMCTCTCMSAAT
eukprot:TRINITY_DN517_c0_g2_i6.p4 TRINITY_DN517_c0_g2~~TRINITY_DN517_c0_g2_i6.p4  ORF type:complete len:121 (+),score=18.32 TRINITY_DN517_c0_g2_i6:222-584(+)